MATCYYQIIFKGNEAYICVDFPDSGFTNLTSTFFTDGENVVVGTPYTLEDGVMTFHFSPDDFDIINDGVIRYIIEYKVDGEDKMLSTNSNAYLKTLSDYSGKTKEDYWEEGYESGVTEQKSKLSAITITANGSYSGEDGYSAITVDVRPILQSITANVTTATYSAGTGGSAGTYVGEDVMTPFPRPDGKDVALIRATFKLNLDASEAFNDGVNEQKSKLSAITITENGDYSKADGFSAITVDVPSSNQDLIANLQGDYYVIPEGTTKLRDYAFFETRYLSNITIPDSVVYIGNHAFMRTSMSSITIPDSVSGMGDEVFSNGGFKEVSIGSGITKLPNGTFYYDSQLYSVSLPSGITEIGEKCFFHCQSLSSITLPEAVTKIGQAAFKSCSNLTEVILPYGLTGIQRDCFTNCVSLTGMNFPSTIQTIGDTCFFSCWSLTEMVFEGDVPPTLDSTSGSNASLGSTDSTFPIYVPCDSVEAYQTAFGPAYAPRVMCREG